jgi:hypothetical protein
VVDADPPFPPRLVEHNSELANDVITKGQRVLERDASDHVAQSGDRELLDSSDGPGVRDLKLDDGVDLRDQVVLGDHGLRSERHDLLTKVDQRLEPIDDGRSTGPVTELLRR